MHSFVGPIIDIWHYKKTFYWGEQAQSTIDKLNYMCVFVCVHKIRKPYNCKLFVLRMVILNYNCLQIIIISWFGFMAYQPL